MLQSEPLTTARCACAIFFCNVGRYNISHDCAVTAGSADNMYSKVSCSLTSLLFKGNVETKLEKTPMPIMP